jgi:hypothetical protein
LSRSTPGAAHAQNWFMAYSSADSPLWVCRTTDDLLFGQARTQ